VEYGSGASRKVRLILGALPDPAAYIAIDISAAFLPEASGRIAADYPSLSVLPLAADYTRPITLPGRPKRPVLGFFRLDHRQFRAGVRQAFLARARATLGAGPLLIGHDPTRDPAVLLAVLLAAYGGGEGLIPAPHLNMLAHLGRLLGAPVDEGATRCASRRILFAWRLIWWRAGRSSGGSASIWSRRLREKVRVHGRDHHEGEEEVHRDHQHQRRREKEGGRSRTPSPPSPPGGPRRGVTPSLIHGRLESWIENCALARR
jgi:hypothetical protein